MLRLKKVQQEQEKISLAQNADRAKRQLEIKECDLQTSQQRIRLTEVTNSYLAADQSNAILSSRGAASDIGPIVNPDIGQVLIPVASHADGLTEREFIKTTIELQLKIVQLSEEFHAINVANQTKRNQSTMDSNRSKLSELTEQIVRAETKYQEEQIEYATDKEALQPIEQSLVEEIAADTQLVGQLEAKIAATELYDEEQEVGERREAAIIEDLEKQVAEFEARLKNVKGKDKK